jgi:hypothetical protein
VTGGVVVVGVVVGGSGAVGGTVSGGGGGTGTHRTVTSIVRASRACAPHRSRNVTTSRGAAPGRATWVTVPFVTVDQVVWTCPSMLHSTTCGPGFAKFVHSRSRPTVVHVGFTVATAVGATATPTATTAAAAARVRLMLCSL